MPKPTYSLPALVGLGKSEGHEGCVGGGGPGKEGEGLLCGVLEVEGSG